MLVEAAGRVSDGEAVGRDLGVGEHRGLRHMGCVVLTTMRRSAVMTIGSNSTPGGTSTSSPTGSLLHSALRFRRWMVLLGWPW